MRPAAVGAVPAARQLSRRWPGANSFAPLGKRSRCLPRRSARPLRCHLARLVQLWRCAATDRRRPRPRAGPGRL